MAQAYREKCVRFPNIPLEQCLMDDCWNALKHRSHPSVLVVVQLRSDEEVLLEVCAAGELPDSFMDGLIQLAVLELFYGQIEILTQQCLGIYRPAVYEEHLLQTFKIGFQVAGFGALPSGVSDAGFFRFGKKPLGKEQFNPLFTREPGADPVNLGLHSGRIGAIGSRQGVFMTDPYNIDLLGARLIVSVEDLPVGDGQQAFLTGNRFGCDAFGA